MRSSVGSRVRLTVFGESHGPAVGCVLEGLPAGHKIDMEMLSAQMFRRAPGKDKTATTRREADEPEILSGVLFGGDSSLRRLKPVNREKFRQTVRKFR